MNRCLIAAVADDGAIGVRGALPWHLGADLRYFKEATMGCPVIMGRRTYESIGKPLPGRLNIVLHGPGTRVDGAFSATSLEEAYGLAYLTGRDKCFVIGGGSVYNAAIAGADMLYLTRVHTTVPDADAFFPPVDPSVWKRISATPSMRDAGSGLSFEFEVYTRIIL